MHSMFTSSVSMVAWVVLVCSCTSGSREHDAGLGFDAGEARDGANRVDAPTQDDCSSACLTDQLCCAGACIDEAVPRGTDGRDHASFENCASCGFACDPERATSCSVLSIVTGRVTCVCGEAQQCDEEELCVPDGGGHRCADLSSDPDNCGAVGTRCAEGETCALGLCRCDSAACASGEACCDAACTNIASDPAHCGGCGQACDDLGPSCSEGVCGCGAGSRCRAPAGVELGQRCCADACVPVDATNCASCGTGCDPDTEWCGIALPAGADWSADPITCCMPSGTAGSHCAPD